MLKYVFIVYLNLIFKWCLFICLIWPFHVGSHSQIRSRCLTTVCKLLWEASLTSLPLSLIIPTSSLMFFPNRSDTSAVKPLLWLRLLPGRTHPTLINTAKHPCRAFLFHLFCSACSSPSSIYVSWIYCLYCLPFLTWERDLQMQRSVFIIVFQPPKRCLAHRWHSINICWMNY